MKATLHCNNQYHQDSDAIDLIRAFLIYQGVKLEYTPASAADVLKLNKGRNLEYSIEFNEKFFSDPMDLISFFINNGLIRI